MDSPHFLSAASTRSNSAGAAVCPQKQDESTEGLHRIHFELAPDGMIISDQEGRILEVNAEVERQFGYPRAELIGEPVEKLIPQRLRDAHKTCRALYQTAPATRPMNRGQEFLGLHKDGTEFPVDIGLTAIQREHTTLFYAVVRDARVRVDAERIAHHLKFERALAGLSAKFIGLPANQVDQEISSGLEVLIDALGTDRASLAQLDQATGDFIVTHALARPGIPCFPERVASGVLPWVVQRVVTGKITKVEKVEDLPVEAQHERNYMESAGEKSTLIVPCRVAGKTIGGMSTNTFREYCHWDDSIVSFVQNAADIFANALSRKKADEELQNALTQICELKEKLEKENVCLREEITLEHSHTAVVGNSAAIRGVLKKAEQVALTDSAVLILGETGTGKELIAHTIHEMSSRKLRPMVKINCAALPATLIESELFGREKGAYTGALAREIGRFELADKSTIFLDEIGELPPEVQSKLLRVLQEGDFERLGSSKTMRVDVRVIAATSRNLREMVKESKFREDLFYRLNVFPILIPPLRERLEDIPALVWHILKNLGKRMGRHVEGVHAATMRDFQRYSWPGNVRELSNVIERNLILHSGAIFRAELPDLELAAKKGGLRPLEEVETEYFQTVLQSTHWRIRGNGGAAEVLGLKPTTLEARLKKLGIHRTE